MIFRATPQVHPVLYLKTKTSQNQTYKTNKTPNQTKTPTKEINSCQFKLNHSAKHVEIYIKYLYQMISFAEWLQHACVDVI